MAKNSLDCCLDLIEADGWRQGCVAPLRGCGYALDPIRHLRAIDWGLGLTGPFFGVPDFINSVKNVDKEFYLVNTDGRQFLVMVTDEFIESRQLSEKVSGRTFELGKFKFTVCW